MTSGNEILYGDAWKSLKDARHAAKEAAECGYGKLKIFKLVPFEEVSCSSTTKKL